MISIKNYLRFCVSSFAIAVYALSAFGMPAKKGLLHVKQFNGESIEVRLVGDEYHHLYMTEDGYPLVVENNLFYYADADGREFKSTGIPAHSISQRSDLDRQALKEENLRLLKTTYNHIQESRTPTSNGMKRAASLGNPSRFLSRSFPNTGKQKALIFLVEYPDVPFTLENPLDYFTRMLNEPGFSTRGATGSAKDFFLESSNGIFDPEFDVFGPIVMKNPREYYGGANEDRTAYEMVVECCDALDDEIDFTEYDRDGDGYIDNIYIFFAGEGESSSGITETVWPHASRIELIAPDKSFIYDGVKLNSYGVSNEWENGNPDGIGTFCHEFSHVMGLPDLYSTNYNEVFDPGEWSILAYGPYNNEGRTPPLYSAFERYCVGWIDLELLPSQANITLPPIGSGKAYAVKANSNDEFFIFENRQQTSWDLFLPHHGMLVWHIDYDAQAWNNNAVNNTAKHQRVDIVEADGVQSDATRSGDCFPGTAEITSFTDDTNPSMLSWMGFRQSRPLTEIEETSDGLITMKVGGGYESLPAPTRLRSSNISTPHEISLEWDDVDNAEDYLLFVYHSNTYLPVENISIDGISTEGKTNVSIKDLEPNTSYDVYVVATNGKVTGLPSDIIKVSTAEAGFEDISPLALDASMVTDCSFIASWEEVENADGYILNVYTKIDGEPMTDTVDFTGGLEALPQGWNTSSKLTYSLSGYVGEAVPSLRLSTSGESIETPKYSDGIRTLSFWHRGNGSKTDKNFIVVSGLFGETWNEIERFNITKESGGEICTISGIEDGCTAARIEYLAIENGSLAIDDVVVGHGAVKVRNNIEGYSDLNVGKIMQFFVEGLDEETEYFYTVKALHEDKSSLESNEVTVLTKSSSLVKEINYEFKPYISVCGNTVRISGISNNMDCMIYSLNGVLSSKVVSTDGCATTIVPTPGVYLLRIGSTMTKLIVK